MEQLPSAGRFVTAGGFSVDRTSVYFRWDGEVDGPILYDNRARPLR